MSERFERWKAKTDPETVGRILTLTRDLAVEKQTSYQPILHDLNMKVKTLIERIGVPAHQVHYYISAAQGFWKLKESGQIGPMNREADGIAALWAKRGLEYYVLGAVASLFGYVVREMVITDECPPPYGVGMKLVEHATGSLPANGLEQEVTSTTALVNIQGYIDLSQMKPGDTLIIRQYMRVSAGGAWKKYDSETYNDAQTDPLVYITVKGSVHGTRITLQQTAGTFNSYPYSFMREENI